MLGQSNTHSDTISSSWLFAPVLTLTSTPSVAEWSPIKIMLRQTEKYRAMRDIETETKWRARFVESVGVDVSRFRIVVVLMFETW